VLLRLAPGRPPARSRWSAAPSHACRLFGNTAEKGKKREREREADAGSPKGLRCADVCSYTVSRDLGDIGEGKKKKEGMPRFLG